MSNLATKKVFAYNQNQFQQLALDILHYAKQKGIANAVVNFTEANSLSVSIRKNEIETIEKSTNKGMSITVYLGEEKKMRCGSASTSDLSSKALKTTVDAAYNIACFTAIDNCANLPDIEDLEMQPRDLKLYIPWLISTTTAINLAKRCELAAFKADQRITNSDGATVYRYHAHFVTANSLGFIGGYPSSQHMISIAPIANTGKYMQRESWYSLQRDPKKLIAPEVIGTYAAKRAIARLAASKLSTRKCPVLFEAPLAISLLSAFVYAISGSALYRKSSFLLNTLGKQVFPKHINIFEDPHIISGLGSASFDAEGVKTHSREVVKNGIVLGYFLSSYSARKLGTHTTGNAGGSHNLFFQSSLTTNKDTFSEMLKKLHTGLLITELMGQGVNYVTGDYSRGAFGYWIQQGIIQHPVEEITISGNLKNMFAQIIAIGNDTIIRENKESGSLLIENMTIAGT